jgi:hypothetical protein
MVVTQNVTFKSVSTQVLASVIYLDVISTQTAIATLDFTTTEIQTAPGQTVTEDIPVTEVSTVVDSVTVSPISTVLLATAIYVTTTETQTAPQSTVTDNLVSTLTQDVSKPPFLQTLIADSSTDHNHHHQPSRNRYFLWRRKSRWRSL